MCRKHWMPMLAVLTALSVGCSEPSGTEQPADDAGAANGANSEPGAAVYAFLDAVRTGDDQTAQGMLSSQAREKVSHLNRRVTPPASDTARFEVGEVKYVAEGGAQVACTWTDLDAEGQPQTDNATWMVRREVEGWRIVGVAYAIFEGEPPLLLDFENLERTLQKQQMAREEIDRRARAATSQAGRPGNPADSVRR